MKKKAKGIRESVKEDKVIASLRAADAAKKAHDNMNSTASYKTHGVQDKPQSVSQSVGQSVSHSKKGVPPATTRSGTSSDWEITLGMTN